jgi:hypothetical protein
MSVPNDGKKESPKNRRLITSSLIEADRSVKSLISDGGHRVSLQYDEFLLHQFVILEKSEGCVAH